MSSKRGNAAKQQLGSFCDDMLTTPEVVARYIVSGRQPFGFPSWAGLIGFPGYDPPDPGGKAFSAFNLVD